MRNNSIYRISFYPPYLHRREKRYKTRIGSRRDKQVTKRGSSKETTGRFDTMQSLG